MSTRRDRRRGGVEHTGPVSVGNGRCGGPCAGDLSGRCVPPVSGRPALRLSVAPSGPTRSTSRQHVGGSYALTGEAFWPAKHTAKSSLTETRGTETVESSTPDRGRTLFARCRKGGRRSACVGRRSPQAPASDPSSREGRSCQGAKARSGGRRRGEEVKRPEERRGEDGLAWSDGRFNSEVRSSSAMAGCRDEGRICRRCAPPKLQTASGSASGERSSPSRSALRPATKSAPHQHFYGLPPLCRFAALPLCRCIPSEKRLPHSPSRPDPRSGSLCLRVSASP